MPRRCAWSGGWWHGAAHRHSPNFGPRPAGTAVSLAVVHAISLPPGQFGGPAVEQFFSNTLDASAHPYFQSIQGLRVSAHFFVRRSGRVLQFVSCEHRAWHAGVSQWRGRDRCNDWSIGIELEGLDGQTFEHDQYTALALLLRVLWRRYGLTETVGHEHIAPGRKFDPGPGFDWKRLRRLMRSAKPRLMPGLPT
jgi:N-acetyl-anhydromuramoyl-L-alanine amidase